MGEWIFSRPNMYSYELDSALPLKNRSAGFCTKGIFRLWMREVLHHLYPKGPKYLHNRVLQGQIL